MNASDAENQLDDEIPESATFPEHANPLDDWCPWSGTPRTDEVCPAMCPASANQ